MNVVIKKESKKVIFLDIEQLVYFGDYCVIFKCFFNLKIIQLLERTRITK